MTSRLWIGQRRARAVALAGLTITLVAALGWGDTIHVPADQPTIQAGIDAAIDGDTVLVADGTYTGAGNRDIDFVGKAITLISAGGATACIIDCQATQGDPHRGFHFHSGETASSVLDGFTVRNGGMDIGGGLRCESASAPIVQNCIFTMNTANPTAYKTGGGAISIDDSSPTFANCQFVGNHVNTTDLQGGGAAFNTNSAATFTNCHFSQNSVTGPDDQPHGGGAMANVGGAPVFINCSFLANSSTDDAGGMVNDNSGAQLTGCTFDGNQAAHSAGAILNIFSASPTLTNCTITNNSAFVAAGMYDALASSSIVVSCSFENNTTTGEDGGGYVCNSGSTSIMIGCRFIENSARGATACCGGVALNDAAVDFFNCDFIGNSTESASGGGGLFVSNNSIATAANCVFDGNIASDGKGAGEGGAIVVANSSTVRITGCTLVSNAAGNGGGAICSVFGSNAIVTNSVLWNNTATIGPQIALIFDAPATASVATSLVQGGESGVFIQNDSMVLNWAEGNLDADPLLVDSDGPNDIAGDDDDDLRLQPGSPCIDAGNNGDVPADAYDIDADGDTEEPLPIDLGGDLRFVDDPQTADTGLPDSANPELPFVDIGAYEFQPPASGDLTGDGIVGPADLAELLAQWGTCEKNDPCTADISPPAGDGIVGAADLAQLLANWG